MLTDRLVDRPRGRDGARRRPAGRGARIDADQPRPAVSRRTSRSRTASEAAVREAGAVPATVAIRDGRLLVGLDEAALRGPRDGAGRLGPQGGPAEPGGGARRRRLGGDDGLGHDDRRPRGRDRGLRDRRDRRRPSRRARRARRRGAGSAPTFDISSDLEELGRTPMAVVCAGPKAILDVPATLEYLETRGVPVVAVGQADLPGFYARSAGIAAPSSVPDVAAAAELVGDAPRARASAERSSSACRSRQSAALPGEVDARRGRAGDPRGRGGGRRRARR